MKTVLDIPAIPVYPEVDAIYEVKSSDDLFSAIAKTLAINPLANSVNINKDVVDSQNVYELMFKHGFDFWTHPNRIAVRFRCYYTWVYFKNDKPIFFDTSGIYTEIPPHEQTFKSEAYNTLEFDRFEKIKL